MLAFTTTVTLFAVCKIKNVIKSLKHAFPNERLIDIHWMTYLGYTITFVAAITVSSISDIGFALQSANKIAKQTDVDALRIHYYSLLIMNIFYLFHF